ncbi:MAG: hypothetical protein JOS17DRAFT_402442 [Linnemannia elongata]|nr:MAG: hypothetical protein JOS17DRAFT_402442 [Linnemannia elongata]
MKTSGRKKCKRKNEGFGRKGVDKKIRGRQFSQGSEGTLKRVTANIGPNSVAFLTLFCFGSSLFSFFSPQKRAPKHLPFTTTNNNQQPKKKNVVDCPCPTTTIEARDHRLAPIDLHRDRRRPPQLPLQRHRHPLGPYFHQPPGHPVVREAPSRSQAPQLNERAD